jgi:hypothetical protein
MISSSKDMKTFNITSSKSKKKGLERSKKAKITIISQD